MSRCMELPDSLPDDFLHYRLENEGKKFFTSIQ